MTRGTIEYLLCDVSSVDRAREEHRWLDSLLSPGEISHANRLQQVTDRAVYRSAHLLFRLMAARRLGLDPKTAGELKFTRRCRSCGGPHGKPQIAGAELSLSKSDGMMALASAPSSSPVGVDIERLPGEVFPGFDDYVLAPTESVPKVRGAIRGRLELWVAKEAALKTTGHGLSLEPGEFEVVRTGHQTSAVTGSGVWVSSIGAPEHPELNGLSLAPLPSPPTYAAALSCADRLPVTSLRLSELLTE